MATEVYRQIQQSLEKALQSGDLIQLEDSIADAHNRLDSGEGGAAGTPATLNAVLLQCKKQFIRNLEVCKSVVKPLRQACRRLDRGKIFAALDEVRRAGFPVSQFLITDVRRAEELVRRMDGAEEEAMWLLRSGKDSSSIDHFLDDFASLLDDEVVLQLARRREELAFDVKGQASLPTQAREPNRHDTRAADAGVVSSKPVARRSERDEELRKEAIRSATLSLCTHETAQREKVETSEYTARANIYVSALRETSTLIPSAVDVLRLWGGASEHWQSMGDDEDPEEEEEEEGKVGKGEEGNNNKGATGMTPNRKRIPSPQSIPVIHLGNLHAQSHATADDANGDTQQENSAASRDRSNDSESPPWGVDDTPDVGAEKGYERRSEDAGEAGEQRRELASFKYRDGKLSDWLVTPRQEVTQTSSTVTVRQDNQIKPGSLPPLTRAFGDKLADSGKIGAKSAISPLTPPQRLDRSSSSLDSRALHNASPTAKLLREENTDRIEIESHEVFDRNVVVRPQAARMALLLRVAQATAVATSTPTRRHPE